MEDLYNQIAKYEKKKTVKTNIISIIMSILGILGLITAIKLNIIILGIFVGFILLISISDLLITNISVHKTIQKMYKEKPILKEGKIKTIENKIITVINDVGMEYKITSVTNHNFNIGDKIYFIGINEFLGMSCTFIRYPFYNRKLL